MNACAMKTLYREGGSRLVRLQWFCPSIYIHTYVHGMKTLYMQCAYCNECICNEDNEAVNQRAHWVSSFRMHSLHMHSNQRAQWSSESMCTLISMKQWINVHIDVHIEAVNQCAHWQWSSESMSLTLTNRECAMHIDLHIEDNEAVNQCAMKQWINVSSFRMQSLHMHSMKQWINVQWIECMCNECMWNEDTLHAITVLQWTHVEWLQWSNECMWMKTLYTQCMWNEDTLPYCNECMCSECMWNEDTLHAMTVLQWMYMNECNEAMNACGMNWMHVQWKWMHVQSRRVQWNEGMRYGVATVTVSRIDKILALFCRILSLL